ncbi:MULTISPECIES: hypothetical protein [Streptomyces]|nr:MULTISPECIES: hypothetical protein [Streptomyces]
MNFIGRTGARTDDAVHSRTCAPVRIVVRRMPGHRTAARAREAMSARTGAVKCGAPPPRHAAPAHPTRPLRTRPT